MDGGREGWMKASGRAVEAGFLTPNPRALLPQIKGIGQDTVARQPVPTPRMRKRRTRVQV